jgi:pyrophosphatase PpaX
MRLYMECYRDAAEPYIRKDLTDEEIRAYKPRSEIRFLKFLVRPEDYQACLEDFYRIYEERHAEFFDGVYDGIPELLDALRADGRAVGIVTGKSRRSWEVTRASAGLGAFDVVVVDDDVERSKPDPEGLVRALGTLSADPAAAIYVGDTVGDMEAAAAAGIRGVAALWANHRRPSRQRSYAARAREEGATVVASPRSLARRLGLPVNGVEADG